MTRNKKFKRVQFKLIYDENIPRQSAPQKFYIKHLECSLNGNEHPLCRMVDGKIRQKTLDYDNK